MNFCFCLLQKLVEFNNLYSAMSIISALQVECIYRLRHTWAGLGNKDRAAYRRLEELFSQNDNCRRQREHMNSISLPGIPYLGNACQMILIAQSEALAHHFTHPFFQVMKYCILLNPRLPGAILSLLTVVSFIVSRMAHCASYYL